MLAEPHAPDRTDVATPRLALLFLALGVAFDLAVNGQRPGAGIAIFVALLVAGTRPFLRREPSDDVLLGGVVVLAAFAAVRASVPLIVLDLGAACGLLVVVAARDETGVWRSPLESFLRRALHVAVAGLRAPAALLVPLARATARIPSAAVRATLRTIVVAVPILALFAVLLGSADRVFGDLILPTLPDWDLADGASHAALTFIGALGVATLWRASLRPVTTGPPSEEPLLPRVGFPELATVLGGIVALFSVFVGVQFAVLFGGAERVEVTPGLTYAEYARSGFFQLLAVALLTVVVILGGWDLGRRAGARQERAFRLLVTAMVALTAVILASALMRLALYEATFGFTLARLGGYVAICWIGAALLALLGAIWTGTRDRVIPAMLALGLVALLVVNVVNPERFVAERNAARFGHIGKIDAWYLADELGHDAVPTIVALLPRVGRADADVLRGALCRHALELEEGRGWRSANLGRARAADALARAGISVETCAGRARGALGEG